MAKFIKDLGMKDKTGSGKLYRFCIVECNSCCVQRELATAKYTRYPERLCKACTGKNKAKASLAKRRDEFVSNAVKIHDDKYDYSDIEYISGSNKVTIKCGNHAFSQKPSDHLVGKGCPICAGNTKKTLNDFLVESKEVHGNKYDYSLVTFIDGCSTKVPVVCKKHGVFYPTPSNHISKASGCPRCRVGTDADCIYMWQLNNTNVYKIGITSTRLGDHRIHNVAHRLSQVFNGEVVPNIKLLASTPNARIIEMHLLNVFKDTNHGLPETDGFTEFRVLSNEDVVYAITYISQAIKKGLLL